jgi:hypothetical protein
VVDRMVVNPRQIMKRLSESINTAASWWKCINDSGSRF